MVLNRMLPVNCSTVQGAISAPSLILMNFRSHSTKLTAELYLWCLQQKEWKFNAWVAVLGLLVVTPAHNKSVTEKN